MKKVLISLLLGVSMVTMAGCGNNSKEVITDEEFYAVEVGETIEVNGICGNLFGNEVIGIMGHCLDNDTYREYPMYIENYDEIDLEQGHFYNVKAKKTQEGYEDLYEVIKIKEIEHKDKTRNIFKDLNKIYNKIGDLPAIAMPSYEDKYFDLEEELNNLDVSDCGMEELQPYFDRAKEKLEEVMEYNILCDYNDDGTDSFIEAGDIIDFIKECLY